MMRLLYNIHNSLKSLGPLMAVDVIIELYVAHLYY
jgi:hypothetical protein